MRHAFIFTFDYNDNSNNINDGGDDDNYSALPSTSLG